MISVRQARGGREVLWPYCSVYYCSIPSCPVPRISTVFWILVYDAPPLPPGRDPTGAAADDANGVDVDADGGADVDADVVVTLMPTWLLL